MKFKSREQQAAVMIQLQGGRARKNRTFARRHPSSKIHTKPVKMTIVRNLWEGDPQGHSEAAKLGWEMRRFGFKPIKMKVNWTFPDAPIAYAKPYKGMIQKVVVIDPVGHNMGNKGRWTNPGKYSRHNILFGTYIHGEIRPETINRKRPIRTAGSFTQTKKFGPYDTIEEAKKAILPLIIVEG